MRRYAGLLAVGILVGACGTGSNSGGATSLPVAIVAEMSGDGAAVGRTWQLGAQMASAEINAQGGILGHPVSLLTRDTKTDPATSVAAMKDALQQHPFAILGTNFSSSTIVNMDQVTAAGVPQFVGSSADGITQKGSNTIIRTQPSATQTFEITASWLVGTLHTAKLAFIWSNNEYGKSGHDALVPRINALGAQIVANITIEQGQANFAGELSRVQRSGADTLFIYANEAEAGKILKQLHAIGLDKQMKITGADASVDQVTTDLAGSASDGLLGYVAFSADASPLQAFSKKYKDSHGGEVPDQAVFQSYEALWLLKYATEKVGKLDDKAVLNYWHDRTFCAKDYPNLLTDLYVYPNGDVDRETFTVQIQGGKNLITGTVPPLTPQHFTQC